MLNVLFVFHQDLMELFCARQRRKFSRGIKRAPGTLSARGGAVLDDSEKPRKNGETAASVLGEELVEKRALESLEIHFVQYLIGVPWCLLRERASVLCRSL